MKHRTTAAIAATIAIAGLVGFAANSDSEPSKPAAKPAVPAADAVSIERGRYLVRITGCNDCHTPGYNQSEGKLPEAEWLKGSDIGFSGPWGVSYPANLRHTVHRMSEDEWVGYARMKRLPPMPWFSIAPMSEPDLRDIYRFIHSLGNSGEAAPTALGPGMKSPKPTILFVPK